MKRFTQVGVTLTIVICVLCVHSVFAQDEEDVIKAISDDWSECGAFYSAMSIGLRNSGQKDVIERTNKAASDSIFHALEYANRIMSVDEAEKYVDMKAQENINKIIRKDQSPMIDFPQITQKYGGRCKGMLEDTHGHYKKRKKELSNK